MKSFLIRVISIAVVVVMIVAYNQVVYDRDAAESALLAEYEQAMAAMETTEAENTDDSGYADGTYTGEAQGFGGPVSMEVVIENGVITEVNVLSAENEDGAYFTMAEDMIPAILEAQSADVDTISGATFSSTGIKDAVAIALEKATK